MVGFDGCFDSEGDFDKCLKQAYNEIDDPYWMQPDYVYTLLESLI